MLAIRSVLRVGASRFRVRSHSALQRCMSASSSANVTSTVEDGVATLTMCRLPVNSLNYEFLTDFRKELENLDESGDCKAVIITSSAPKIFSAGLDIMEMVEPDPTRCRNFWLSLQDMWSTLYTYRLPTVALINGHAPAGGCLISCGCDYRIMLGGKGFNIGLNETKLGIVAPFWFMDAFVSTVGERPADLHLQLGTLMSAEDALAKGLVDELAGDEGEARAKALAIIKQFLSVPPFARYMTKSSVRSKNVTRFVEGRDNDLELFLNFVQTPQTQKSLKKYVEALKAKKPKS